MVTDYEYGGGLYAAASKKVVARAPALIGAKPRDNYGVQDLMDDRSSARSGSSSTSRSRMGRRLAWKATCL